MQRIVSLITVLFCVVCIFAEEPKKSKTRYYRHEVNISRIGVIMHRSQWEDYENKVYQAIAFEREHDGFSWFGPSSSGTLISYYYHLNHRIAVGAMTAFTTYDSSLSGDYRVPVEIPFEYWDSKEHTMKEWYRTEYTTQYLSGGKISEKSFFLMPSLKWSWLNNSWCSMYMKASAGLHYQRLEADTGEFPVKSNAELDESNVRLAYVVTPFGWEIGRQKVRGFFELGFGSNTNLQFGLIYRFCRY